jgi:hypothetical protein
MKYKFSSSKIKLYIFMTYRFVSIPFPFSTAHIYGLMCALVISVTCIINVSTVLLVSKFPCEIKFGKCKCVGRGEILHHH